MASTQWTPMESLKSYGMILARKMAFVAVGWLLIYFLSQPLRKESDIPILWLFAPMIGGFAGLVAGWYMATDAADDSSMNGLPLWVILVVASTLPMWVVEGVMHLITGAMSRTGAWPMNFSGFMEIGIANLMALAAAVYVSVTQE